MTLYYNQHLGMMKPLVHGWPEKLLEVPPRSRAKQRMNFLNKRHLFDCPNCRRIVRWDFGADVGHKDAHRYQPHGDKRQLEFPLSEEAMRVLKLDKYMRLCCDDCWSKLDSGEKPRKGWDR